MSKGKCSNEKNGPSLVKILVNTILRRADLPPEDTKHWVATRKLAVVRAVIYGLISLDNKLKMHAISEEEFSLGSIWLRSM